MTDGPGWVVVTTFTPDGRHVLSVSDNAVYAHDAASGKELWRGTDHTDTVVQVVVTPDGRTAITSGHDGLIVFCDVASGKVVRTLENPRHATDVIAIAPDGKTLAALGGDAPHDAILRRWDIGTGKAYPDAPLPPKGPKYVPSAIRYTPDGSGIAIASGTESQVPIFDPAVASFDRVVRPTVAFAASTFLPTAEWSRRTRAMTRSSCGKQQPASGDGCSRMSATPTAWPFRRTGGMLAVANTGKHAGGQRVVRLLDAFTGESSTSSPGTRAASIAWRGPQTVGGSCPAVTTQRRSCGMCPLTSVPNCRRPLSARTKPALAVGELAAATQPRSISRWPAWPAAQRPRSRRCSEILRPVPAPDADLVAALVRELDGPQFAVREKAAGQLGTLGEGVEGPFRKALEDKPSAEARDRIEKLLEERETRRPRLRQGRALEVLERSGAPKPGSC